MSSSPHSVVAKTRAWWEKLLQDDDKLNAWLARLEWNEHVANIRFHDFTEKFCDDGSEAWFLFQFIAKQEQRHSKMVGDVLEARGVPSLTSWNGPERYWDKVMPCAVDEQTAAGVAALAEGLSLERLRVLRDHPYTPKQLMDLFADIEKDEQIHALALANVAGKHGIASVIDCHSDGLVALGLKLKEDRVAAKPIPEIRW